MDFYTRCQQEGMKLLKDDKRFLENGLRNMPANRRISILRRYREIWLAELGEEKDASKQNVARFKANSYLRAIIGN